MTDSPVQTTTEPMTLPTPPIAKLEDLEAATINMVITLADNSEVTWPMRMLPQYRQMQLTAGIVNPQPPLIDFGKGGVPVYNHNDPAYIAGVEEAAFKRNSILIAEMSLIDIPGETLEERATYIREKFDPLVTEQIVLALKLQREKGKARIISRAATFPR